MSAKHFINDPAKLVSAALHSVILTNPSLALDSANKIIYRRPTPSDESSPQVSIISGGGSGHEPSFAGMVGKGLLSAAVAGTIFASPSAEQVRAAITSRVNPSRGILVTVMNYTGDILNFGVAVERARAAGLRVEMVVVGDDVGVGKAKAGKVGRRGIAGTVLVHKISGALAAQGRSLEDVAKVANLVASNLVSVGASLDHVHVPGRAVSSDNNEGALEAGEVELGMGIHNEPGSQRFKNADLSGLLDNMLAQLLDPADEDRAFVNVNSNEVVLLVNNLGGVSPLELGGITAEVVAKLKAGYNITPVRILSGTYMTSLNGPGFSITLLNVVNTDIGGPGMIDLLDYHAEATGWTAPIAKETWEAKNLATREANKAEEETIPASGLTYDVDSAKSRVKTALERVIAAEPEITRYDTVVGDGDCGIGLKRGAEAILQHLASRPLTGDAVIDVSSIVPVVESTMDGTSGALYAIFLHALVGALRDLSSPSPEKTTADAATWAKALKRSSETMGRYTPARPGDRTLVDALAPFIDTLEKSGDVVKAAEAAREGAERTKGMKASLGRTVYVGGSGFEEVPDPGAWGLSCFFGGFAGVEEGWEAI